MIVRHEKRESHLDLWCEEPSEIAFAAFYADCIHEVRPVTEGYRLALIYNLTAVARDNYRSHRIMIGSNKRSRHC